MFPVSSSDGDHHHGGQPMKRRDFFPYHPARGGDRRHARRARSPWPGQSFPTGDPVEARPRPGDPLGGVSEDLGEMCAGEEFLERPVRGSGCLDRRSACHAGRLFQLYRSGAPTGAEESSSGRISAIHPRAHRNQHHGGLPGRPLPPRSQGPFRDPRRASWPFTTTAASTSGARRSSPAWILFTRSCRLKDKYYGGRDIAG